MAATVGDGLTARRVPASDAATIANAWRDFDLRLMQTSGGANPFFLEPMLRPALAAFGARNAFLFCLFDGDSLVGLAPFETVRGYAHLPLKYVRTWRHPYGFFGAPNIKAGYEVAYYSALFQFIDDHPASGAFLRLEEVEAMSAASWQAERGNQQRLIYVEGEKKRASFKGGLDFERYYTENVRAKKRKEVRRLTSRLAEQGEIKAEFWRFGDDLDAWINDFLRLEGQGWKGEAGTSLAASEKDTEFFCKSMRGMARAGALLFQRISVGGRTIAMLVNFIAGGVGYSFKICHDDAYDRFSPGVLIELELMKYLGARPDIWLFDSCASEGHPMICGLWADRRKIVGVNISAKSFGRREVLHLCAALEDLSRRSRRPKEEGGAQ